MSAELDATDWAIIGEVQRDARLSFNQIANRVNLSAPSVARATSTLAHASNDPAGSPLMEHPSGLRA